MNGIISVTRTKEVSIIEQTDLLLKDIMVLKNGLRHREDGPARIWPDGDVWYYLNGIEYTKEEYETEVAKLKLGRIKDL
jgi:hypothetical protein